MERDRGFNFKLLVPPRVNLGQVSDVGRQKAVEKIGDNMKTQERVRSSVHNVWILLILFFIINRVRTRK